MKNSVGKDVRATHKISIKNADVSDSGSDFSMDIFGNSLDAIDPARLSLNL